MRNSVTQVWGGRVASDGTATTLPPGVTSRKTATGIYVVTFPPNIRLRSATYSPTSTVLIGVVTLTSNTLQINSYTTGSVATDGPWAFTAVGVEI